MIEKFYEKEIDLKDIVYDSFVFNHQKYAVLKKDHFEIYESYFAENKLLQDIKNSKRLILAKINYLDSKTLLLPVSEQEYISAIEYYLKLKKVFLKEWFYDKSKKE